MFYLFTQILAETPPVGQDSGIYDKYKPFIWVALILILGFFLLIRTQRRVSQSMKKKELTAHERVNRYTGGKDIYSQINLLMSDLADLSRQINGQIDTRIAKLQIIMRQAEQTIARLENLTGNTPPGSNTGNTDIGGSDTGNTGEKLGQSNYFDKTISDISDEFHHQKPAGVTDTTDISDTYDPNGITNSARRQDNSSNSLHTKQTLDLSAQGYTALQIAQELNRPVGEIELILALQAKKDSSE